MSARAGNNADTRWSVVFGVLTVLAFATVLYLTFQGPKETTQLSGGLKAWLFNTFGWDVSEHALRSNIHLVMYFGVGLVLALFIWSLGWKHWAIWTVIIGCVFGLLDETIKIFLPTREFDVVDLVKDWVGVAAAIFAVWIVFSRKLQKENKNHY